jgi:hypothetical protein
MLISIITCVSASSKYARVAYSGNADVGRREVGRNLPLLIATPPGAGSCLSSRMCASGRSKFPLAYTGKMLRAQQTFVEKRTPFARSWCTLIPFGAVPRKNGDKPEMGAGIHALSRSPIVVETTVSYKRLKITRRSTVPFNVVARGRAALRHLEPLPPELKKENISSTLSYILCPQSLLTPPEF